MGTKFIIAMLTLFVIDLFWLSTGGQYSVAMHNIIQQSPVAFRYIAIVPVYAAMAWLLLQAKSIQQAGLTGLSTYAIYDFTNYALLKNYDIGFAVADTLWGGFLFATAYTILERISATTGA
jgi:uncharacterized membrane protein